MISDVPQLRVRTCGVDQTDIDAVLLLADQAKQTVGFLTPMAIQERIDRGTVLVATDDSSIVGYTLYDLRRDRVKLGQLVVDPARRGEGIARLLVEDVAQRHMNRQGIELNCRRDFPAHKMWPQLGFTPVSEKSGRAKGGSRLNHWWRSFAHPNLLTLAADLDERPLAVLDTNVVIAGSDGPTVPIQALLSDWTRSEVRLGAVPGTYLEIDAHKDQTERNRHKEFLSNHLERLEPKRSRWEEHEQKLLSLMGMTANPHLRDVLLVSQAAASDASWFVTGDRRFQRAAAPQAREVLGIEILLPGQAMSEVGQRARGEAYRPIDLMGTDIEIREAQSAENDQLVQCFVSQRVGERHREFRALIELLGSEGSSVTTFVFACRGELLAMAALRWGEVIQVPICRVRPGFAESTLGRNLLGWLRSIASEKDAIAIEVTDRTPGHWASDAFASERFIGEVPTAVPVTGFGSIEHVHRALARLATAERREVSKQFIGLSETEDDLDGRAAFEIESIFHPFVHTFSPLQTYRIPVRSPYASELFDRNLKAQELFSGDRSLALRREHVYFRSPKGCGIAAPGRILWHVTGDKAHGGATIRATSLIDEVIVGDARQLSKRFEHLGVLSRDQIDSYAANGVVMAIRFSHTMLFTHPVSTTKYLEVVQTVKPGVGVTWAGVQPVDEAVMAAVLEISA